MCKRRAEQGEHCIAYELVNKAAKALHRCCQFLEKFVLKGLHNFWIELFAQCGETTKVGKQDGNGAAISIGVWLFMPGQAGSFWGICRRLDIRRCVSDLGPAFWAKREVGWTEICTARARDRLFRAAFWAERKTHLNVKTATGAVHLQRPRRSCDRISSCL